MATADRPPRGEAHELSGVVIGWDHRTFAQNIHLTVQSASSARPEPGEIGTHHLLMTRNQAMLLAGYLMRLTGQEPALPRRKRGWLERLFG